MTVIKLAAGEDTNDLIEFITQQLDDETLDQIEVEPEHDRAPEMGGEPIMISVALALGPPLIAGIVKLVDKWLETSRQEKHGRLVIEAYGVSAEAGEALRELSVRHADVEIQTSGPPAAT